MQTTSRPLRVSVLSPVGAALIGVSPAQCIDWRDPDGRTRILTVLDVRTG
jgi:regulator of nucleoside diphosphate kinase